MARQFPFDEHCYEQAKGCKMRSIDHLIGTTMCWTYCKLNKLDRIEKDYAFRPCDCELKKSDLSDWFYSF